MRKITKRIVSVENESLLAVDSIDACRMGSRWGDTTAVMEEEGDEGPSEESSSMLGRLISCGEELLFKEGGCKVQIFQLIAQMGWLGI